MNNEVKEIIVDLITRLYYANFGDIYYHDYIAVDRNIFEAEMKEIYNNLDEKIGACDKATAEDYEDQINCLEEELFKLREDIRILIEHNFDLNKENDKLKTILTNVSEAVNVTWS